VLPDARIIFCVGFVGDGVEGGERARQRMEVVCALKRNVSENWTVLEGEMVAVMPWRTRS
jgi:hypothetical protein